MTADSLVDIVCVDLLVCSCRLELLPIQDQSLLYPEFDRGQSTHDIIAHNLPLSIERVESNSLREAIHRVVVREIPSINFLIK